MIMKLNSQNIEIKVIAKAADMSEEKVRKIIEEEKSKENKLD